MELESNDFPSFPINHTRVECLVNKNSRFIESNYQSVKVDAIKDNLSHNCERNDSGSELPLVTLRSSVLIAYLIPFKRP